MLENIKYLWNDLYSLGGLIAVLFILSIALSIIVTILIIDLGLKFNFDIKSNKTLMLTISTIICVNLFVFSSIWFASVDKVANAKDIRNCISITNASYDPAIRECMVTVKQDNKTVKIRLEKYYLVPSK